jgi:hypothetical protein
VLLLGAGIAALLLGLGQDGASQAGKPGPGATPSQASRTGAPAAEKTPEAEGSRPSDSGDGGSGSSGGGGAAEFVEDYYAALPDDTRAGYERLSPSYRKETTFSEYDGFWSTVDSVTVEDTAPAGANAVDVTLVYDGAEREVRRIHLERGGGEWLIADDEVVG